MTETPHEEPELPPSLRFLKRLVTILTITMILGVIAVVAVLVTRLPRLTNAPDLPAALTLPDGAKAQAVTYGADWIGVVTTDNRILIFTPDGKLRQEIIVNE